MIKRSQLPPNMLTVDSKTGLAYTGLLYLKITLVVMLAWLSESIAIDISCILLIGTLQYHFNILGHEGLHHLLHKKRKINDILCRWFIEAPVAAPMSLLRKNHLNHHKYVGQDKDDDKQYYEVERFKDRRIMALWLISALLGGMTLTIICKIIKTIGTKKATGNHSETRRPGMDKDIMLDMLSIGTAQLILLILYTALFGPYGYFIYWVLPLLTLMMGLNVIRSCAEHALVRNEHSKDRLYSFRPHWLEAFFLSPYNMNYHAEHHLLPTVPCHQLKQFAAHLQTRDDKQEIAGYPVERSYLAKLSRIYRHWNDSPLQKTLPSNIG